MEIKDMKPGKVLAIISDSADLHTAITQIEAANARKTEKLEFIKKQVEAIYKTWKDETLPWWSEIESVLKAKGKLPEDYDTDKGPTLEFSREGDCIRVAHPTQSFLDMLFRSLT